MANNSQFSIDVWTTLNTDNVPKQIDELNAKLSKSTSSVIKLQVGIDKDGNKQFDDFIKKVNVYKDKFNNAFKEIKIIDPRTNEVITDTIKKVQEASDGIKALTTETHKWTTTNGEVNKWVTTVDNAGNTVSNRTKQYKNDVGELVTETSKWTKNSQGQWKQVGDTVKTITDDYKKSFEIISTETHKFVDSKGAVQTWVTTIDDAGKRVSTRTKEIVDSMGQITQTTTKLEAEAGKPFKKVGNDIIKISELLQDTTTTTSTTLGKITDTINGVTQTFDGTITTIKKVSSNGEELTTVIGKYRDTLGRTIEVTDQFNKNGDKVATTIRNISDETQKLAQYKKELVTTTLEEEKVITRDGQQYKAVVRTIEEETAEYGKLITTITTYKDSLGRTNVETRKVNEKGEEVAQTTRTVTKELDKGANSAKNYGSAMASSAQQTRTFGQVLSDTFARLARYYIASIPIQAFRKIITETITTVKEFDSAITEMGKVTDYSGEKLRKYTKDLGDLGTEVARTRTEMTEAATGWLKAGYSEEDAAQLSKYSALLQNTADEEMSAAEATSVLVSQLKAYHMEADEAVKITDIINAVSAEQAVSSYDLSQGLTVASAAMNTFGNSIEETTALLTAGTTVFQGRATQVARGLNMIATRVAKNKDALEEYGVAIYDENNQLKSTYQILTELSPVWEKMSNAERVALGNTLAGTNQYKILSAVMSQLKPEVDGLSTAQKAYNQALQSSGVTMKQNAVYMESIEARTTALKAEFEKLVLGNGGLENLAKELVSVVVEIVKFINSLGGLIPLLVVFSSVMATIKADALVSGFVKIFNSIVNLTEKIPIAIGMFTRFKSSGMSLSASLEAVGVAASTAQLAIGALTAVISIATIIISKHNQQQQEMHEQAQNAIKDYENYADNLKNVCAQIENETTTKQQLLEINKDLNGSYDEEKGQLQDINDLRKDNLKLLYEEAQLKAKETLRETASEYEESASWTSNKVTSTTLGAKRVSWRQTSPEYDYIMGSTVGMTRVEQLETIGNAIDALNEKRDSGTELSKSEKVTLEALTSVYNELNTKLIESQNTIEVYKDAKQTLSQTEEEFINKLREEASQQQGTTEISVEEQQRLIELYGIEESAIEQLMEENSELDMTRSEAIELLASQEDATLNLNDAQKEMAKILGISEAELIANANAMHLSIDSYYKYANGIKETKEAIQETSNSIDGLQDALDKAQVAFDEYNEKGFLTLDTFQDLMSVSAEYLIALVNEEGQLEINQETLGNLVEVLKQEKIEELQAAEMADILAYANGDVAEMSSLAKGAIADAGSAAATAGSQAEQGSHGFWSLTEAISAANAAARGDVLDASHVEANIQKIHNAYAKLGNQVKSTVVNTTKAGNAASKAGKKGAGAAKEATDATKELNKELEETKSKYEKVISFITGRIDKQTKAVQKQKETEVDAIEKIIKAREKQKDKELDAIEEQINALEKEKDAREKYWDDQIDALKKANDERKDALELQEKLDALEKAKNTKVKIYKEGQGFVYDVDQTAVAEAQQALDEYLSEKAYEDELERLEALKDAEVNNYDQRLDALNQYKDNVQKSYEDQIAALEAQREALEEQYDAQIEYYNNFKEQFEDMVKAYEDKQTELLASQLTGINFENNNWMTRLDNLAKFVNEYNRLQEQLNTGNKNNTNTAQLSSGGGGGGTTPSTKSSTPTMTTKQREATPQEREYMARVRHVGKTYASGTPSVKDNEIAIVGENPNQEIVIGSKVNNGELMSLTKGTGVVNADSSKTLAGMLNQVGQFGSSGFGSGNGTLSNINNDSLTINGVTIQGANIKDPETFVNGLLNLKAEALQRAYRHR